MSARADALAARLAEVSGQAIEVIERIPDERWGTTCEAEGWTVAATARHWTAPLWLFDDCVVSAQEFIERVPIGHIDGHLASIRATAGV